MSRESCRTEVNLSPMECAGFKLFAAEARHELKEQDLSPGEEGDRLRSWWCSMEPQVREQYIDRLPAYEESFTGKRKRVDYPPAVPNPFH